MKRTKLTPEENKAWENFFSYYLSEGKTDKVADELTWKDMQRKFPRLKSFYGIEEGVLDDSIPYIDDQGQLHYQAYVGTGRAILRESLPKDHPEYLFNYLEKHGIDWKLYFEDNGRKKGIDHEHGDPYEKIFGLGKKKVTRLHTPIEDMYSILERFTKSLNLATVIDNEGEEEPRGVTSEMINSFIREELELTDRYTRSDMERAFAAGGANAAKERVWKKDGLCLPVLDFNQWLEKYENEGRTLDRDTLDKIQAQGRMYRKGQGEKIEIVDITTNSEVVEEMLKGVAPIKNINKSFLHEIPAEVVMLSGGGKTSHLFELNGKLYFEEYPDGKVNAGNKHLYFLSNYSDNEKPQAGDWVYIDTIIRIGEGATEHPTFKGVFQIEKIEHEGNDVFVRLKGSSYAFELRYFKGKKIIATTDCLTLLESPHGYLPQPKDAFLFFYIGAHNVGGRKVEQVVIEAELLCCQTGAPCGYPCNGDCEKNAVKSMVVDISNTINMQ